MLYRALLALPPKRLLLLANFNSPTSCVSELIGTSTSIHELTFQSPRSTHAPAVRFSASRCLPVLKTPKIVLANCFEGALSGIPRQSRRNQCHPRGNRTDSNTPTTMMIPRG